MAQAVVFLVLAALIIGGLVWLFWDSMQLLNGETENAEIEKPRQKNWTIEDTTVAVFIATFGVEHLEMPMELIARILGRSEGSLDAKVHRIRRVNSDETTSDLSVDVLNEYRSYSLMELLPIVKDILLKFSEGKKFI